MNRFLSLLAVAVLLIAESACSSAKPPAPAAIQGSKIVASLKDLGNMYEKKNLPGFMSLISDNYPDRQAFSASVESVFSKYETVHFTIQYTRMFITVEDKGMTRAMFNWDSDWQTSGGDLQKNGGRATFVFDPNDAKLVSIDGKNPFIPQAVETPGKQ
jgi:hypothetical protein